MGHIFHSIVELAGHTPLIEFPEYEKRHHLAGHILGKYEARNPAGSIKDRAALNMILRAREEGRLAPGDTIVEQTSGNTGIALVSYANVLGYHTEIFLESGVTKERKMLLKEYGAVLRDYRDIPGLYREGDPYDPFREASLREIERYCAFKGPHYVFLNQTANPANPEAHMETTGPEIWEDAGEHVDALLCMVGTGGTLYGLSTYLRGKNPALYVAAVSPAADSRRCREHPDARMIDGVVAFEDEPENRTPFIEASRYDECIHISSRDAFATAREIARTEGLLLGTSAAAAWTAAAHLASRPAFSGQNIVAILPDGGGKYFSCGLFDEE